MMFGKLQKAHPTLRGHFAPAYLGGSNKLRAYLFFIYEHTLVDEFAQCLKTECSRALEYSHLPGLFGNPFKHKFVFIQIARSSPGLVFMEYCRAGADLGGGGDVGMILKLWDLSQSPLVFP